MSDSSHLGSVLNQAWGKFFPGETFAELNKIFSSLKVLGHLPLGPLAPRLHPSPHPPPPEHRQSWCLPETAPTAGEEPEVNVPDS